MILLQFICYLAPNLRRTDGKSVTALASFKKSFHKTAGRISSKPAVKHSWVQGIQISSKVALSTFSRIGNNEISKVQQHNFKIFLHKSSVPIPTKRLTQVILGWNVFKTKFFFLFFVFFIFFVFCLFFVANKELFQFS